MQRSSRIGSSLYDGGNFKSVRPAPEPCSPALRCRLTKERDAKRGTTSVCALESSSGATVGGRAAVTSYRVTLRDRETQIIVGYYDGSWTTDRRRALALRAREAAEAH